MFTILFIIKNKPSLNSLLNKVLSFLVVGQRCELSNFLKEDVDNILNQDPTTIEIH
jgi:hypothetical protein